ncbi:MAG: polymerase III, epsilon subunit protein, partial [Candidatus Saccharibacteria bacterium GW2011_GWC2_48_9]
MFSQPAVFVDIETNGGNGPKGRIIEVGLIRVEDGEVVREYKSLVNPGTGVPVWIERLTGIRNSDLVGAPYFEDIAEELRDILGGAIFVAHNVRFDYSFFRSHFAALGHDYKPKLFCTVRMSRGMYPEHKGHSLEKIINRHNIAVEDRHRAYDDARAIYEFAKLAIAEKGHDAFLANAALQMKTKTL